MPAMNADQQLVNELAKHTIAHLDGVPDSLERRTHRRHMIFAAERAHAGVLCCSGVQVAKRHVEQAIKFVQRYEGE